MCVLELFSKIRSQLYGYIRLLSFLELLIIIIKVIASYGLPITHIAT